MSAQPIPAQPTGRVRLVKTDDQGRPKLRIKLADWNLRGFRSIAERYGEAAPEVEAWRAGDKAFGAVLSGDKLFA